jgi:hypothetical protein
VDETGIAQGTKQRRLVAVLALLALAPWAAECSWGGFTAVEVPFVVVVLAPLYGAAAVLIRETARRVGGGWPAIVLLAAAFGIIQAGLVDRSLFNLGYLDDTEFAADAVEARRTMVPLLRFNASQAVSFIGGHIALSICAPIAIVESFTRPPRNRPWLGTPGLIVIGVLYFLGSMMIYLDEDDGGTAFPLAPVQLAVAVLVTFALIGAAVLPRWRHRPEPVGRPAPRPWMVALPVIGARLTGGVLPGWYGIGVEVLASAAAAVMIVRWSRRAGWGQQHVLAAWGAVLVIAAASAYTVPNYKPASPTEALVGDIVNTLITIALLAGAAWRLHRQRSPAPGEAVARGGSGSD